MAGPETNRAAATRGWLAALAVTLAVAGSAGPARARPADIIYLGGDIVTVNDAQPAAEALAVRDGRILALGKRADIEKAHRGPATRVVDLGGKALLPGFVDPHSHFSMALSVAHQANVSPPPVGPGKDVPGILAAIEAFRVAQKVPKGAFLMAYGYDDGAMPDGRLLTREDLDRAFPDNPVVVTHVSMHGGVLNSAALARVGISADTPTPPGGVIVRKPGTNEPWGLIMETAWLPVVKALPRPAPGQEREWAAAGQELYTRTGLTLAQEGATHADDLALLRRLAAGDALALDVVALPFMTDLDPILAATPVSRWGAYERRVKIGGVKIVADGSPQGRTAYFTTPYLTGGPNGEQNWRGEPTMDQAALNQLVRRVYELGVPLLIHTNGDAAIDMFLEAYERARDGDFSRPWNVTCVHAQFVRRDQLERFVRYRIRPSFFSLHTFYFAAAHTRNRGAAQTARISPLREAIDLGLRPTNHTDFPVEPLDQLAVMWSAVNRVSREGTVIGADQRITPLEALKTQTIWAAEQYGEEALRGSLEPGKLADFVILDRNPLRVDPMRIRDIRVVETVKEGKTVYRAS